MNVYVSILSLTILSYVAAAGALTWNQSTPGSTGVKQMKLENRSRIVDVDQLWAQSDLVADVTVESLVGAVKQHTLIFSDYRFLVRDVIKGDQGLLHALITFRRRGGAVDGERQEIVGYPALVPGERYVAFLKKSADPSTSYYIETTWGPDSLYTWTNSGAMPSKAQTDLASTLSGDGAGGLRAALARLRRQR